MNKTNKLLKEIANLCKEKHYSLVTAESCTGGGLAYFITRNPESSSLLERGYITYSVSAKKDALGISTYKLQVFGVVSKEISIEMAEKALQKSKAQVSISITGLDQESIKKEGINKAGIAWVSCTSIDGKTISKQFKIKANRGNFCEILIHQALNMLLSYLN